MMWCAESPIFDTTVFLTKVELKDDGVVFLKCCGCQ
jgi:hypothetical protein